MSSNQEEQLKALTREAMKAAEAGQWDHVAVLYERRGRELALAHVSSSLAKQLREWDQTMQGRIRLVQAAIHQNISDVQERRRKLQQLKQGWVRSSKSISRFARTA